MCSEYKQFDQTPYHHLNLMLEEFLKVTTGI